MGGKYQVKTIIAGSRWIADDEHGTRDIRVVSEEACYIQRKINEIQHGITEVVSGKAKGPDTVGERWAIANRIPVALFPAEWKDGGKFNRAAGIKRNAEMGRYADALIAFWDGQSPGTRHMIQFMERLGKTVAVFRMEKPQSVKKDERQKVLFTQEAGK